jgi:hypothetical protein
MEMEELRDFVRKLHGASISNNVRYAMDDLQLDEYGRLSFEGYQTMNRQYPQVMMHCK